MVQRRTPKHLVISEWDDIASRLRRNETWASIADDYGMAVGTLSTAARKRGLKPNNNGSVKKRSALPASKLRGDIEVRHLLARITKETGEKDPEKVVVMCRDQMAEVADAIRESILKAKKYEGMPNLGMDAADTWDGSEHESFCFKAAEEEFGLRDYLALLQGMSKLELERLNYHKPKLAAEKRELTGKDGGPLEVSKVDLSELSKDEREVIRTIIDNRASESE